MLEAVITSVNFSDFLSICLPENKKYFDNIIVATALFDTKCIELCKQENVQYITTDRFFIMAHLTMEQD